jgi:hypothetical protein
MTCVKPAHNAGVRRAIRRTPGCFIKKRARWRKSCHKSAIIFALQLVPGDWFQAVGSGNDSGERRAIIRI